MSRAGKTAAIAVVVGMILPITTQAQSIGQEVQKLHTVLENLYNEMIPLCSQLIGVARGIAAFGATFYIGARVWKHIANAEPIDFYPLLRPFALAICIALFPSVLGIMNSILKPTVNVTSGMVQNSNEAVQKLLAEREQAIKATKKWQVLVGTSGNGDRDEWYRYENNGKDPAKEGFWEGLGNSVKFTMQQVEYRLRNAFKLFISIVLEIIYYAAALCIDTIRTFHLVVLAIIGPLVFALAVFDGFQHTLTVWLGRYINIYMWLPVANLFGSMIGRIQENMIKIDLGQIQQSGDTFFTSTDIAYMIFLVIGTIGYFTVPSVANYIVHASGGSALLSKTSQMAMGGVSGGASMAMAAGSMVTDIEGDDRLRQALAESKNSEPYMKDHTGGANDYQRNKISGS